MEINWQTSYYRYRRYFTSLGYFYRGKKARTYAGIILSILATTFLLTLAIKPTLITIAGLIKQIDDQKLAAEKLQNKINALSQAQNEYEIVKNELPLVDQALPENPEVSTLIKQLEALSYQSGVVPESIKIGQAEIMDGSSAKKETGVKEEISQSIRIKLTVSGDYQKLKTFFRSLSSLRRLILVDSFSFKAEKDEKQNLTLNLEAAAYYLQPTKDQTNGKISEEENDRKN